MASTTGTVASEQVFDERVFDLNTGQGFKGCDECHLTSGAYCDTLAVLVRTDET